MDLTNLGSRLSQNQGFEKWSTLAASQILMTTGITLLVSDKAGTIVPFILISLGLAVIFLREILKIKDGNE